MVKRNNRRYKGRRNVRSGRRVAEPLRPMSTRVLTYSGLIAAGGTTNITTTVPSTSAYRIGNLRAEFCSDEVSSIQFGLSGAVDNNVATVSRIFTTSTNLQYCLLKQPRSTDWVQGIDGNLRIAFMFNIGAKPVRYSISIPFTQQDHIKAPTYSESDILLE